MDLGVNNSLPGVDLFYDANCLFQALNYSSEVCADPGHERRADQRI